MLVAGAMVSLADEPPRGVAGLGACAFALLFAFPIVAGLALLAAGTATIAATLAHHAAHGLDLRRGDRAVLHDGRTGSVRELRWWYAVVDTDDGATVLCASDRVRRTRPTAARR